MMKKTHTRGLAWGGKGLSAQSLLREELTHNPIGNNVKQKIKCRNKQNYSFKITEHA
ncbi:hypothetical protein [Acetobacter malorum]|uniref:hypothetical protein n=1 Tax=Acetobacter malorum TaxID=178901 RepID=UPI0039EA8279